MNPNDPYQTPAPTPTPQPSQPTQPPVSMYSGQGAPVQPTIPVGSPLPEQQSYQQPQNTWNSAPQQQPSQPQANPYSQQPQNPTPYQGVRTSTPPQSAQTPNRTPPPRVNNTGKTPVGIRIAEGLKKNWLWGLLGLVVFAVAIDIIWQVAQPMNVLPRGLVVDGMTVGGKERDAAAAQLDEAYGKAKVELFFGKSSVPFETPEAKSLGISADNTSRLAGVSYSFGLRFVPTSYFWASNLVEVGAPVYSYDTATLDQYALKNLGEECTVPVKNATLKLDDGRFTVVSAEPGGKCNMTDFKDGVKKATLASGFKVKTDMREVDAPITNEIAQQLADELNNRLTRNLPLQAGGQTTQVKSDVVKSWLSFYADIPEATEDNADVAPPRLLYKIEQDRVKRYLETSGIAAKVEKEPGVTKISTTDFAETSRTEGAPGVLVDIAKTVANIDPFINGRANNAEVAVGPVPATVQYNRKYTPSDAGYRALIEQFAHDNAGDIAISVQEISGKKPLLGGTANANKTMPAAGLEGMFIAYAAQKGIEDGSIQSTDQVVNGLSYTECMEAAISDQDGDCISGLLGAMSVSVVEQRLKAVGMNSTILSTAENTTTAADAALFLQKLKDKQLGIKRAEALSSPTKDLSLREGIKRATGVSIVAGGATDTSYNEIATISNRGQYHVVILTKNADGAKTTTKFLNALEELRTAKQDLKS